MVNRLAACLLCLILADVARAELPSLMVRGHLVSEPFFSLFAAPDEPIRIGVLHSAAADLELVSGSGVRGTHGNDYWMVNAPTAPGLYEFSLRDGSRGTSTEFRLFVGYPVSEVEGGILNGYLIGPEPPAHNRYPAFYTRPELLFEVTQDIEDTRLSTHFTLRQFLCKQESGFPKYLVIKESLLVLLEGLLDAVRQAGYHVDTFGVISAYRTPHYNQSIGNVPNSRHVYGDAMDLFIDADGDGQMDDLNGDGQRNAADVDLLYNIVQDYKKTPASRLLVGGIGRYYKTTRHGGFVHVDARGFRARW